MKEARRYNILLVDDEREVLTLYKNALSESEPHDSAELRELELRLFQNERPAGSETGFDLTLCSQGDEAVETVRSSLEAGREFSVVFLDVRMPPGPDGIITAERIRQLDKDVHIVMVTAYSDVDPGEVSIRVGPRDKLFYAQKPIYLQEIQQFAHALSAKWEQERELRRIRAELESRVQERTRELSLSNELLKKEIGERIATEQALTRSEAIYRQAIENASGVPYRHYYADGERYEFIGRGIHSLLELEPGEMSGERLGCMIREVRIADPDAPEDLAEYCRLLKSGGVEQYRVDMRMALPSGEERWISDHAVPLRDQKTGDVVGTLGILQDITTRKQMEEAARQQQEQMIQADRMVALGTLVAGVAHEINNPNNFIMLSAPVLQEAWESIAPILEEYHREHGDFIVAGAPWTEMRKDILSLFSAINSGAERISKIVKELRDFSRNAPPEMLDTVDINRVARSAVTLLERMIAGSTGNFVASYEEGIPEFIGNFQRLEQVVVNLIQNACQALTNMEQGVFLKTGFDPSRRMIHLEVKDEGAGFSQEIRRRITDPFFTTKRDRGGVGLGLSVSARIVSEHRGTLEFESEPGRGTRVLMSLPLVRRVEDTLEVRP